MTPQCAIPVCNRPSRGLCDCCQRNLCLQHLNEHNNSLINHLNVLNNDVNSLDDRLKTLHTERAIGDCRRKLEQWRDDCHAKIDRFFKRKCHELDRLINGKVGEQREKLTRIQAKVAELIAAQETTRLDIDLLASTVRQIRKNMDKIEQTCFTISARPIAIDDTIIRIKEKIERELYLTGHMQVYKTLERPCGSYALASNGRFLLVHQQPNLCLVDQEMNIINQALWFYDTIYDMCWCATLNRFIVIGENDIVLVDETTMTIERVKELEKGLWLSCTCSNTSLFLSTGERGSSIREYRLTPSVQMIREWRSPDTCSQDEVISGTIYNNGRIAMTIVNIFKKSLRFQLRDAATLNRIWSIRLDIVCNQNRKFGYCSLRCEEWLLADYESRRLVHITKNGKIKKSLEYNPEPYYVSLFGPNMLAVSTKGDIRTHKL